MCAISRPPAYEGKQLKQQGSSGKSTDRVCAVPKSPAELGKTTNTTFTTSNNARCLRRTELARVMPWRERVP